MFIVLLLSSFLAHAQTLHQTSGDIIDILSQQQETTLQNQKELSNLEDLNNTSNCVADNEIEESCETLSSQFLPSDVKSKDYKVLFEIQYRPSEQFESRELRSIYNENLSNVNANRINNNPATSKEIDEEVENVFQAMKDSNPEIDKELIHAGVIFETIKNGNFLRGDQDLSSSNSQLANQVKDLTSSLSDDGYLKFLSYVAGSVDYDNDRATYDQSNAATKGNVTPFEQITGTRSGICGDIHSMISKFGELRGWEAFTVGYAMGGNQHVVAGMVNPKDPDKLMIVNYGQYEELDLDDGNWVKPTPASGMDEVGIQMRIFKNKNAGDLMGDMQQIATIPTPVGTFFNQLFQDERYISKTIENNNFRRTKAAIESNKNTTTLKNDGNKIINREVTHGISIYEGEADGTHIYGVAVSRDVFKKVYKYDKELKRCVPKKNKYFSMGFTGSKLDLPSAQTNQNLYAYLNIKGGQIVNLYQTDVIQFKGLIGYEFEAFATKIPNESDKELSGDANLAVFLGALAEYNKNGTKVQVGLKFESSVGLKNQTLITDFSTLGKNISPLNFNAASLDVNVSQRLPNDLLFVSNNNLTYSRVGGRVLLSAGLIKKDTSVMLSYNGTFTPLKLGNSLQEVNLLQNLNGQDGLRLNVGQQFNIGNFRAMAGGYVNMTTSTPNTQISAGGSLKVNLQSNKKKKKK